ncbi:MAG: hypothetical protein Q8934_09570 [Bacillota bacterium]|nr:hypothetical protein [Bacillota bacterium]
MERNKERPARIVLPKLYNLVNAELEKRHIHAYDYQAMVIEQDNGIDLILQFGENFSKSESHYFTNEMIEKESNELLDFIQAVGESCKNIMIADYFKMMKS